MKRAGFRCVLLSNLLEHVQDREKLASSCEEIVGTGGLILATVPSSYPYHADPIDTEPGAFTEFRIVLPRASNSSEDSGA